MIEVIYNDGTEAYDIVVDGMKAGYARFDKGILLWFSPIRPGTLYTVDDVRRITKVLTEIQREKGGA